MSSGLNTLLSAAINGASWNRTTREELTIAHNLTRELLQRIEDKQDELQKLEEQEATATEMVQWEVDLMVEVLVYHYRSDISGCGCGWAELGRSWPEHAVQVYQESRKMRMR